MVLTLGPTADNPEALVSISSPPPPPSSEKLAGASLPQNYPDVIDIFIKSVISITDIWGYVESSLTTIPKSP